MPCFIKNDCKLENHFEWEAIPLVIGCSTSYRSIGSRLLCLGMNGWEMYSSWYLVSVVGGAVILGLHKFSISTSKFNLYCALKCSLNSFIGSITQN